MSQTSGTAPALAIGLTCLLIGSCLLWFSFGHGFSRNQTIPEFVAGGIGGLLLWVGVALAIGGQ